MKIKVTGEEKHYQKLNSKLTKELRESKERHDTDYRRLHLAISENIELGKQLEIITKENEFLKSKLNLTGDEVRQLLLSSKSINDLASMTSALLRTIY